MTTERDPESPGLLPLAEVRRLHVLAVLARCGDNRTHAAQLLGVDRRTLGRQLNRWGLGFAPSRKA